MFRYVLSELKPDKKHPASTLFFSAPFVPPSLLPEDSHAASPSGKQHSFDPEPVVAACAHTLTLSHTHTYVHVPLIAFTDYIERVILVTCWILKFTEKESFFYIFKS